MKGYILFLSIASAFSIETFMIPQRITQKNSSSLGKSRRKRSNESTTLIYIDKIEGFTGSGFDDDLRELEEIFDYIRYELRDCQDPTPINSLENTVTYNIPELGVACYKSTRLIADVTLEAIKETSVEQEVEIDECEEVEGGWQCTG